MTEYKLKNYNVIRRDSLIKRIDLTRLRDKTIDDYTIGCENTNQHIKLHKIRKK